MRIINNYYSYVGFSFNGQPNGLGALIRKNSVSIVGMFKEGFLNGYGRQKLDNESFQEGLYKGGKLHEIGLMFDNIQNKYRLNSYLENRVLKTYRSGDGVPIILICKFLKKKK